MSEIPKCRNAMRQKDHESDMRLKGENESAWVFQCDRCELVQVVSKDGVTERSRFENAARVKQQEEDRVRRWESRKKFF